MIKMKFTYMIYSMYENDDENLHYDAHSRLIETSSDLVYIHEYDDYYKEYQHDMTEELSDAYQKIFDKKMNEFSG